jgi:hypothetical protein
MHQNAAALTTAAKSCIEFAQALKRCRKLF